MASQHSSTIGKFLANLASNLGYGPLLWIATMV
jgi:hypothetical protein